MKRHGLVTGTWCLAVAGSLMLLAALVGGTSVWAADAPNVTSALPDKVIPQGLGFNVHIMGPDKDWDEIKAAGGKFIRADFTWDGIERSKGVYDFSRHDQMLDSLDARGIRAILILDYNNRLYLPATVTDEGREAYAKWAAASVKHYKGRGVLWEIWNEPNVGFWRGGTGGLNSTQFADQYVELVKKAVPAMRAADPDCYILGGSVSCLWRDSFRWIDEAFKQGLLKTGINALSVHPYGFSRPELCIDEGYGHLRDMMAAAGAPKDFPVVNTESGYDTNKNRPLEHQAMISVRWYLVDQMCDIRTSIWYNWDENDAATMRVRSRGGEPLPIYKAIKNMTAELTGYHFVERLKVGSNVDYVLAFEDASKGRKIVAWTVPQARDESQDKAQAHDVAIPTTGSTSVAVRDLYGKDVQAKVEAGSVTVTLTASPQYIDCIGRPRNSKLTATPSAQGNPPATDESSPAAMRARALAAKIDESSARGPLSARGASVEPIELVRQHVVDYIAFHQSGGEIVLPVKTGQGAAEPATIVAADADGLTFKSQGAQSRVTWKALGEEGICQLAQPLMAKAPVFVEAAWLKAGIKLGHAGDAAFKEVLEQLRAKDAEAAKVVESAIPAATPPPGNLPVGP